MAKAEEGAAAEAGRSGAWPSREGSPLSAEESECRICYNRFDLERHAPKMLGCLHTFCRACLSRLHRRQPRSAEDEGSSWASSSSSAPRAPFLACPVCRALTALPAGRVQNLPVNTGLVEAILLQLRGWEPLLRDLRPQRLLWPQPGSPSPPASSASSASPSPSLSPSGVVTFRSLEAGTCLQEPRGEREEEAQSCSAVCRRKAGCACFLFLALALALLAAAWMEWLTGSLFLAVALLLLFASTVPFLYSFNSTFRRQPRTIFFTRAGAAGGSREGASSSSRGETLSSRPSADGRSRW